MEDKKVVLMRKQNTEFKVNYPYATQSNIPREYTWLGTQGKVLNEKPVPFEVFEWLRTQTTTFQDGCLIIKKTDDEIVNDIKENIANIEDIENSIMTKDEVEKMLSKGNQLVLKKALDDLTEGKEEGLTESIKRYIISAAQDIGVDSSAKQKVLCEWAGINCDTADILFNKDYDKKLEEESKK